MSEGSETGASGGPVVAVHPAVQAVLDRFDSLKHFKLSADVRAAFAVRAAMRVTHGALTAALADAETAEQSILNDIQVSERSPADVDDLIDATARIASVQRILDRFPVEEMNSTPAGVLVAARDAVQWLRAQVPVDAVKAPQIVTLLNAAPALGGSPILTTSEDLAAIRAWGAWRAEIAGALAGVDAMHAVVFPPEGKVPPGQPRPADQPSMPLESFWSQCEAMAEQWVELEALAESTRQVISKSNGPKNVAARELVVLR